MALPIWGQKNKTTSKCHFLPPPFSIGTETHLPRAANWDTGCFAFGSKSHALSPVQLPFWSNPQHSETHFQRNSTDPHHPRSLKFGIFKVNSLVRVEPRVLCTVPGRQAAQSQTV